MDSWYKELVSIAGNQCVSREEDMSRHTSFRAGGRAKYFVQPEDKETVTALIRLHSEHQMPYYIMGNGSNLLVSDSGYDGTIIKIGSGLDRVSVDGQIIYAESGAMVAKAALLAARHSLSGMEFAAGIPGSIGGAAAMNAGAYGGEIKDILIEAEAADRSGNIVVLKKADMEFGYRTSVLQSGEYVELSVKLGLNSGKAEEISEKMNEYMTARKEKQPLEFPSAGSTFKRPEGHFAGKLIMDAGLAGYSVGGACVSEKHCGFVINKSGATAEDILTLMEDVRKIVYERFGVILEPEVKIIGNRIWRQLCDL